MARYPDLATLPKNNAAKEALIRAVINVQEGLPEEVLDKLIDLMVRRLEAVIESGGWYTKY